MSHAGALWGVVRRDAHVYLSYRLRWVGQLASVFLTLALFFFVSRLVGTDRFPSPGAYFAFVVVGLAIVEVLTATLSALPRQINDELLTGTFERIATSPLGPVRGILAMTLFPTLVALASGAAIVVVGGLAFGMDVRWATVALALPVAALGAAAFAPFGLLLTALVLKVKRAGSGAPFLVTGLALLSGAFFPVALLPWWLRWVSEVQPLTPALDLVRHLVLGAELARPAWASVLRLVLFAAVLLPVAVLALRRGVRAGLREGTLLEY